MTGVVTTNRSQLHQWALELADDYVPDGWERVSSSPHTRVAYHATLALYYKEFFARSPAENAKARFRGSRAQRATRNAAALLYVGIDAPRTLYSGRLPSGSEYLYSLAAPGESIKHWLRKTADTRDTVFIRRQLLSEFGRFIGRLHATGFVHGDLRPGNVLAEHRGSGFHFTLLDNERNQQLHPPPGRALLKNLMQLNMLPTSVLSKSDRLRFFKAWHTQMRELTHVEAGVIASEALRWALDRMVDKTSY
ncbi:MAG: lipopolysaccharide kinase InaA family protein [Pseudomonadota bacterium]